MKVKKKVVNYMAAKDHLKIHSTRPAYVDAFTGKKIHVNGCGYRDVDDWRWTDEMIYYIEEYDVLPPIEFVEHVLDAYQNGFRPHDPEMHWKNK